MPSPLGSTEPALRAIDLGQLDADGVFAELERTIGDMAGWMRVLEQGLKEFE